MQLDPRSMTMRRINAVVWCCMVRYIPCCADSSRWIQDLRDMKTNPSPMYHAHPLEVIFVHDSQLGRAFIQDIRFTCVG
jgi:hypothetical protein